MRISYDEESRVLRLVFSDTGIFSREIEGGVKADYDSEGRLTAINVPEAMATASGKDIFRQIVVDGIEPFTTEQPLILVPRLFKDVQVTE